MKKQVITAVAILDQIDALIEERAKVMMIEARAIVEAFDIQTNLRRRGDKALRPKYAVRVKRSAAGVQIHWHAYRLERHHKQGRWLLRLGYSGLDGVTAFSRIRGYTYSTSAFMMRRFPSCQRLI